MTVATPLAQSVNDLRLTAPAVEHAVTVYRAALTFHAAAIDAVDAIRNLASLAPAGPEARRISRMVAGAERLEQAADREVTGAVSGITAAIAEANPTAPARLVLAAAHSAVFAVTTGCAAL